MTVILEQSDRDQAAEYLHRGRYKVLSAEPFFGYCACRLGFTEDDGIQTLCTDGQRVFYNPYYVLTCKDELTSAREYAISEVLHEVLHNILLHTDVDLKEAGYDIQRAMAAMDHAVNIMIKQMGYPVHKDWLCNMSYEGMTWREIYEKLPPMASCQCVVKPQDKSQKGDPGKGEKGDSQDALGAGAAQINDWDKIVVEAAKFAEAMGKLPGFAKGLVEQITKPRVDWRSVFYRFMCRVKKGEYSFRRPNKRYLGRQLILPSLHTYTASALIAIDTSGSTWAFLSQYWSEIWGILKALGLDVDVILCDAEIQGVVRLKKPEDVFKMEKAGGGGTDFRPVFEYVAKGYTAETKAGKFRHVRRPEVMAFFTDTYGMYPDQGPDYSVLWCASVPRGKGNVPPFGQVLYLPN